MGGLPFSLFRPIDGFVCGFDKLSCNLGQPLLFYRIVYPAIRTRDGISIAESADVAALYDSFSWVAGRSKEQRNPACSTCIKRFGLQKCGSSRIACVAIGNLGEGARRWKRRKSEDFAEI
ncbi:hypothetical protein DMP08_01820 [Paraeggerthella hongkongensis]|uniref:Uncharacterized protein n=1 Tax=Paraeggerthella hongkongensis TaxID=230658 RepID=A0A3N0BJA8_9ACTN|nr:hypothetical protein DMP08_01820 [Paraeggerthella hongkongensis]